MEIVATRIARTARTPGTTYLRRTNFYPTYDGANDQVDRVSPVIPAGFQIIIPRYRLSTSETRDLGTGPAIDEVAVGPYRGERRRPVTTVYGKESQQKAPAAPGSATLIDLFA